MSKLRIWVAYPTLGSKEHKCLQHHHLAYLKLFALQSDAIKYAQKMSFNMNCLWNVERYTDDSTWHGTSCAWMDPDSEPYWMTYDGDTVIQESER